MPVFKYLESQDVDEVGYTLRTASLMTDPEYYFDQSNPGDYTLFGVRYLLLPDARRPPVPAILVMTRSPFALWELPSVGYTFIARAVGVLRANRGDIGTRSIAFLRSPLPDENSTLLVDFNGNSVQRGTFATGAGHASSAVPDGQVVSEQTALDQGSASVRVRMTKPGLVVLSASFDPGWTASVDGKSVPTVMVAPALVAVTVAAGTHQVVFRYEGFSYYLPLLMLPVAVIGVAVFIDFRRRRQPAER